MIASSALRIGRIPHTDLLMDAKDLFDGLWRGSAGCAAHRRKRARLARHAPDQGLQDVVVRTRSDWSASGIHGFAVPDVKPGHGLTRVLSFPSPSGWRDQMTAFIGRREFIALLGGAAASWPLAAQAQQPGPMRRISVLSGLVESDPETPLRVVAFRQALGKLGWSEGRDLVIDFRWGAGDPSLLRVYAKELIGATPDVVVAESTPAAAALRQETSAVSIVFLQVGNPIGSGFVASLAHPGGNLTGFTNFEPTMGGKWLELLKEIAPPVTRAIAIFNPDTHSGQYWQTMEAAAPSLTMEFKRAPVRDVTGIESAVGDLAREPNGGVVVMPDAFTLTHLELIIALTARHRLPSIYPFRVFTVNGGLLSYGIDHVDVYRRVASYVDRILKGEKPADLPVQAPTKYELVVNLKTAKALGLDVPSSLLPRADEVIE